MTFLSPYKLQIIKLWIERINKMKKNFQKGKKILITLTFAILALIIFFIPAYFFYFNKVAIYEPVSIKIKGLNAFELQQIDVYGITPLNRKYDFQITDSNIWQNDYSFLNSVGIEIPEPISQKITQFDISIGSKKSVLSIKDLKFSNKSKYNLQYVLSPNLGNESSILIKSLSIRHWTSLKSLFKYLFPLALFILIFIVSFKIRKRQKSPQSILSLIEKKLEIRKALTGKIKIWVKIIFYSLFIACTLFFGFLLLLFTASNYITSILFIVLTGLLIYSLLKLLFKKVKMLQSKIKWLRIVIFMFSIVWLCIETSFRMNGSLSTYNELQHFFYISGFQHKYISDKQNPDLLVHLKYDSYIDNRNEFAYEIRTNNEGLRDIDHTIDKPDDEYRIICIGNSFTEGIGTPQDSTWTKLLENKLNIFSKKKITVFNAGIAGSDPFFGYRLLEKKMLKYKPDLVLVAIASSDYNFYHFRGGFERFIPDGYQFRQGPYWEKFYAVSYICRYITDDLLQYKYFFTKEEYKEDSIKAMNDIYNCIHRFYELSLKTKFAFSVVFYDDNSDQLDPVMDSLKKEKIIPVFDLFEYNRNIEKLTYQRRKAIYWPIDRHCNSRGYDVLAKGVEWNLKSFGILDSLLK